MSEDLETALTGQAALARVARMREEATRIERTAITDALARADGSEKGAAEILGLERNVMHALLRRRYPDLARCARDTRVSVRGHAGGGFPRRGMQASPGEPSPGEPSPGEPSPGEPSPGEPSPGEPSPGAGAGPGAETR
jgi:hypothetical protein